MELKEYIYEVIIPKYSEFDEAHKENHALTVISQSMQLMKGRDEWLKTQETPDSIWLDEINPDILLAAAAYHDLGLINGRERHNLDSGVIIRADRNLKEWFDEKEIETIAQAAEDHRASGKGIPRSIYGMIVAEADRVIDEETIIRRTVQFGFRHYPELEMEGQIERAVSHLREKYGRNGYLKLWIPWSNNAIRLNSLQELIEDSDRLIDKVRNVCAMV